MLASREYANAFAHAIRTGAKPGRDLFADKHKVLYDALTIAGGDPAGEDGGFLVPEDIDRSIREYSRALDPLEELFNVESTTTNSGWRVVATDPTKGMTKLTGEGTNITGSGEEPTFKKVTYTLDTYGDWLQVSNELANDEVANLFAYISRYYARKYTITNNGILKAQLEKLTAGAVAKTDDALAAIKKVLNVELDPAISVLSTIIVNQDGFNYLDALKDDNGRPLLMPDPTNATGTLLKGRRVKVLSNAVMPTRTVSTTRRDQGRLLPDLYRRFHAVRHAVPAPAAGADQHGHRRHGLPHQQHRNAVHCAHGRERIRQRRGGTQGNLYSRDLITGGGRCDALPAAERTGEWQQSARR